MKRTYYMYIAIVKYYIVMLYFLIEYKNNYGNYYGFREFNQIIFIIYLKQLKL